MTTLYIAGPMTGLPDNNYPAFHKAEAELQRSGYDTLNPARIDDEHPTETSAERTWGWYMKRAVHMLTSADGVALLPGWTASRGATLEHTLAAETFGMPVHDYRGWVRRATLIKEALA